jgi:hypothetical protein
MMVFPVARHKMVHWEGYTNYPFFSYGIFYLETYRKFWGEIFKRMKVSMGNCPGVNLYRKGRGDSCHDKYGQMLNLKNKFFY